MSSIYLINVGANTGDSSCARSPVFEDGRFVFVPFPTREPMPGLGYAPDARPFLRNTDHRHTHADPDWTGLTYGDRLSNARAAALSQVQEGDILLFWGLLWRNRGSGWSGFTGEKGWYLLGSLYVEEIGQEGQPLTDVSPENRARAARNAHFVSGGGVVPRRERVFIGSLSGSRRYEWAVDLGVHEPAGLVYSAFTSAEGEPLSLGGNPLWSSSLRSCRRVVELRKPEDRTRIELVREAILRSNDFDILEGL